MKKTIFFVLCIFFICLMDSSNSDSKHRTIPFWMSEEYHIENIESNIIKMTNKYTGEVRYHTADVSPSLNETDPNIQVFDLMNTDTNLYKWKYKFQKNVLVGSEMGVPMLVSDVNNNNRLELIGSYMPRHVMKYHECAIAEVNHDTSFNIKKVYTDSISPALKITDFDRDGLIEFNLRRLTYINNYESLYPDSFPDTLNFRHEMWQMSSQLSDEIFMELDGDSTLDVLYIGDDSLPPHGHKIYIAEYNSTSND